MHHSYWLGKKLYGLCEGHFGRDSYDDKVVEGVANDWVVARQSDGVVVLATFTNRVERDKLLKQWSKKPNDYEEYND